MPFRDNLVLFRSRLAANLPQAALNPQSVFMGFAQAFLSADADTQALISSVQPDLFLTTAVGVALDRKAADYGERRQAGFPARAQLSFTLSQPAASFVTIPAGTLVSTVGDGLITDSVFFRTESDAFIDAYDSLNPSNPYAQEAYTLVGTTKTAGVFASATVLGTVGNVAANTIIVNNAGLMGGLLQVTNPNPAYGGLDAQTDASLRASALATLLAKYSPRALEAAALAVNGVFDAHVHDPQDGGGYVNVYWCDSEGFQPGLTGEGSAALIQAGTLADRVNVAVQRVLPPNVIPYYYAFDVFDVLPMASYMAPPGYETGVLTALIQKALAGYVNGLLHGQAVTLYGMTQYVTQQVGGILVDLVPAVSPSFAATESSPTTLYRYAGDPSSLTCIRHF